MKKITAKFKSRCAETGQSIAKGETMYYDYSAKKCYSMSSNKAKEMEGKGSARSSAWDEKIRDHWNDLKEPNGGDLNGWDGYSRKGQAIYDQMFEREMSDADKYDPSDRYGHYENLDPAAGAIQAEQEAYFDNFCQQNNI